MKSTNELHLGQVGINRKHAKELSQYLTEARKREFPFSIPWRGPRMVRFEVYRIPISALHFNLNNTRIRAELEGALREKGLSMGQDDTAQQNNIETILLESKFIGEVETQKLREDLQRRGQLDPVISTVDGVLIDGNRRLAIFRSLSRDPNYTKDFSEMDVSVLPSDATRDDLKELEMRIQMSHPFRVQYGNFNTALEFRYLHRILHWSLERIEELTLNQYKKIVIEDMIEIIDLVDEYLALIPPEGKYEKHYSRLNKGWEPFHNLHYTLNYWQRRSLPNDELLRMKIFGFQIIHHPRSTYADVRLFNKVLKDKDASERLREDSDTLSGRHLESVLDQERIERELENLRAAKEILRLSEEDPKKSLRLALKRIERIKISRLNKKDREMISLLKSIKMRIAELERRFDD